MNVIDRKCEACGHTWQCKPVLKCSDECMSLCLSCWIKKSEENLELIRRTGIKRYRCFKLEDKKYLVSALI